MARRGQSLTQPCTAEFGRDGDAELRVLHSPLPGTLRNAVDSFVPAKSVMLPEVSIPFCSTMLLRRRRQPVGRTLLLGG